MPAAMREPSGETSQLRRPREVFPIFVTTNLFGYSVWWFHGGDIRLIECELDLSSHILTEPSLPVDSSVCPGIFVTHFATWMDVVAMSCPGRVCIRSKDRLSSRSISLDGEEADAAYAVGRFAREST